MATTVNANELLEWFQDANNKCYFNSSSLTVKAASEGSGLGVFARTNMDPAKTKDPHEPYLLFRVDKCMTINGKNCSIANLLVDEELDGIDALMLAVIYEIELQEKSPWFGYLKSINHTTDSKINITHLNRPDTNAGGKNEKYILPVPLWPSKDIDLLQGTEVEMMDGLDDNELRYHYAVAITFAMRVNRSVQLPMPYLLQNTLPPGNEGEEEEEFTGEFDELKFKQFAALFLAVTSRAFDVDNFRDLALVPGADLFNHNAYQEEHAHFVTLGGVCQDCGKDECGHNQSSEDEDDEEIDKTIDQLTEITMDYVQQVEAELAEQSDADSDSEDNEFDPDLDPVIAESYLNPDDCCDIVLVRKVKKGEEVFNTYGDLSNAELLLKYGFAVEANPNDVLTMGPEISQYVQSLVQNIDENDDEHSKELMGRLNWWVSHGYGELQTYIEIQQEEEQGCCDDDDCEGCEEEGKEGHGHEHSDGHGACGDADCGHEHEEHAGGCCDDSDCDDSDCEEDEDDEYQWMEDCKLGFPGHFNGFAIAVATLFTCEGPVFQELLEAFEDEELMSAPGYAGAFVEKKLILESNKKSNEFLKQLIDMKLKGYNDKNKPGELKRLAKKGTSNRKAIYTILMNEKKMLEFALKKLK